MSDTDPLPPLPAIYGALSQVMADVRAVAKDDVNSGQGFRFRGIDAVVNAVGPALRKHAVIAYPIVEHAEYTERVSSAQQPLTVVRLRVRYCFVAGDGSHLDAVVVAESMDRGDKATAKAMSVAYRTALLQALCLPTDEPDPDHDLYELGAAPAPPAPLSPAVQRATAAVGALGVDVPAFVAATLGRTVAGWHDLTETDAATLLRAVDQHRATTTDATSDEAPQ